LTSLPDILYMDIQWRRNRLIKTWHFHQQNIRVFFSFKTSCFCENHIIVMLTDLQIVIFSDIIKLLLSSPGPYELLISSIISINIGRQKHHNNMVFTETTCTPRIYFYRLFNLNCTLIMYKLTCMSQTKSPQSKIRRSVRYTPQTILYSMDGLVNEHFTKLKLNKINTS
jgi:hypothetical protein